MTLNGNLKRFDDEDIMPFGKWKDFKLSQVPTSWLHWFWHLSHKHITSNESAVLNYISRHIFKFKAERPDLEWKELKR